MIDMEKVIAGLEFTKAMITFNPSTGEDIEPGNLNEADKTTYDACVNAILLLKEQEPRLMTLEEVKKHNNKDNCVWFELRNIVIIPVFVRQDRQETIIENPCILSDQTIPHLCWKNIDYCKKWRCWTAKPTEDQRQAVKWE